MDTATAPQRPYREVLDWLTAQVERLDAHTRELAALAESGQLTPAEVDARSRAIVEAHAWLADQLAQALSARGIALAA